MNKGLADNLKVRVLAGDPPIDWAQIKGREDWPRMASTRDSFGAELVGREILQKGHKALLIYGAGHVWRNARGGSIPADSTLVPLLQVNKPVSPASSTYSTAVESRGWRALRRRRSGLFQDAGAVKGFRRAGTSRACLRYSARRDSVRQKAVGQLPLAARVAP